MNPKSVDVRGVLRRSVLVVFTAALTACKFESDIPPLVLATLPPQPEFGPVEGSPAEPEELPAEPPPEPLPLEPVQPVLTAFCTLDAMRVRSSPAIAEDNILGLLPGGSDVTWAGEQQVGDGHTWYLVEAEVGQSGWIATDWLRVGDCNQALSGGETPTIIESATDDFGNSWLDPDANTAHFGVDISSAAGDNRILAPYTGSVVAQDPCDACVDETHPEGQREGEFDAEYNFGYGAMAVVEFRYADLTEAERSELADDGIELGEGQSLYMFVTHLDPNQAILAAGTALGPEDVIASIGTSGNSSGPHAHVEAAINDSGLAPAAEESTFTFWTTTVAERPSAGEPGLRFDPTPLFDIDE